MEDFDNMDDFKSIDLNSDSEKSKSSYNNNNYNNGYNSNSYNKFKKSNYNKKEKPKRNIIGEATINLWNEDKVEPLELDTNNFKTDVKYVTMSLPSQTFKMSDDNKKKVKSILKLLKAKNYKIRFICNFNRAIYKEIVEVFDEDDIIMVTPWESYCKESKEDTKLYIPSDENIRSAAFYSKNFNKFNPALQYIYAAVFTTLYGQSNDKPSEFYITYDPYKVEANKVDFSKSKDTANYFLLSKPLGLNVINLSKDNEYADIEQLLL